MVPIDSLTLINEEWSLGLAGGTLSQFDILGILDIVDIESLFELATLVTFEGDLLPLTVHWTPLCNHSTDMNKFVQVDIPQVTDLVFEGKVGKLDEHLGEDLLVGGVVLAGDTVGGKVEVGQDYQGFDGGPYC